MQYCKFWSIWDQARQAGSKWAHREPRDQMQPTNHRESWCDPHHFAAPSHDSLSERAIVQELSHPQKSNIILLDFSKIIQNIILDFSKNPEYYSWIWKKNIILDFQNNQEYYYIYYILDFGAIPKIKNFHTMAFIDSTSILVFLITKNIIIEFEKKKQEYYSSFSE